MPGARYLTAAQAAGELGISVATLYAYVSRGLIRSEGGEPASRARRYSREDVEKLKQRKEQRRNPAHMVEQALHWGAPVLESALTLVEGGRLYYRGHDVAGLAGHASFEQVAALLWTGELAVGLPEVFARTAPAGLATARAWATPGVLARPALADEFQLALARAAPADPARYDLRPAAVAQAGVRILYLLANVAAGGPSAPEAGIAGALQRAWAPSQPQARDLLNAALVLCADHELNVSSFTARCVASAGSTPYAAVIAGLAALQGTRHGGQTARVEALLREAHTAREVRDVLAGRLARGEGIPGFGHVLYPEGDPRGRLLLDMLAELWPDTPTVRLAAALEQSALELIGERPTIDLALAVLAAGLNLPEGAALAIFALGRTAGWLAHAMEQYETGQLIRPRARYIGSRPAQVTES